MGVPAPAPRPTGPSVVLVTLDTTRADHLGPYGATEAETPTLDALAARGRVFERAYSSAPLTIPSHSTMFTGRAPPSHGVRDNGDFVLPDEAITLAERFQAAGWATAAFTSAFPTHRRWGFSQGFDVYRDPLPRDPAVRDWRDQRRADEVVEDALGILPTLDGPAFVWLHLFDAHWPYDPPEPWASRHPGRPYDGEIAFADAQLGRFLEAFEARFGDTLVVVTADHGEGLGDGGEQTHGFLLHDGTLHVPLVMAGPGVPPGREDAVVSHVDLAPTLLALAGLPLHDGLQGRSLLEGGSGEAYAEALTGQVNLGLLPLTARTDAEGRLTRGSRDGWYAFDGAAVSVEERAPPPGASEALDALIDGLEQAEARRASLDAEDVAMLTALGYLSAGDPLASAGTVDPRDVIDLVPLTWQARQLLAGGRLQEAEALLRRLEAAMGETYGVRELRGRWLEAAGDPEAAMSVLVGLWEEAPTPSLAVQLGELAQRLGDPWEAETWFQQALDALDSDPKAMAGLVRAALAQGDTLRAEALATGFVADWPDLAELRLLLAELALASQRLDEAARHARIALAHRPFDPSALSVSAQVAWALGRPDPAIDRLRRALDEDPLAVPARILLTRWLLEVGRHAEAVRTIRPGARLLPERADLAALHDEAREALAAERRR